VDRAGLRHQFERVRALSRRLAEPLAAEDFRVQSMPDVSPPYWSLGHTSWFFARNVLAPRGRWPDGRGGFDGFDYLFNSYYESLGPRLPRAQRGQVARPTTAETFAYRAAVDAAMAACIGDCADHELPELAAVLQIGLQHEQQHQELFLTEILHIRWSAPLRVPYAAPARSAARDAAPMRAAAVRGGTVEIGHRDAGFGWDNELPSHRVFLADFTVGDRLVTNAEWLAFMADGGYRQPLLWLDNGWTAVQEQRWQAPLYWEPHDGRWQRWSLRGPVDVAPADPVCHVSFYEADAFARWYGEQFASWHGARLPTEPEWEHAARTLGFATAGANLLDDDVAASALDVRPARAGDGQWCGDVWEWTQSHYEPYPGYRPLPGALTEYNGKFMDNQRVLRGGSFATPRESARVSYRNFWPAHARFQATGLRLSRSQSRA
jgi:ergothioneine biosynthesis protein EgtB